MPITDTLKTAEEFRGAGFSEEQASLLAHKLEEAIQANNQDLKEFIRGEFEHFETRMDAKFSEIRVEFHQSMKDLTIKLVGVMIAVVSLAVAVIKLFPDLH